MQRRLKLTIHGQVQGKNFRTQLRDFALQLGVSGFAKNESDGTVSATIEGAEVDLQKILNLCYNGIRNAEVTMIDAAWANALGEFQTFDIL